MVQVDVLHEDPIRGHERRSGSAKSIVRIADVDHWFLPLSQTFVFAAVLEGAASLFH